MPHGDIRMARCVRVESDQANGDIPVSIQIMTESPGPNGHVEVTDRVSFQDVVSHSHIAGTNIGVLQCIETDSGVVVGVGLLKGEAPDRRIGIARSVRGKRLRSNGDVAEARRIVAEGQPAEGDVHVAGGVVGEGVLPHCRVRAPGDVGPECRESQGDVVVAEIVLTERVSPNSDVLETGRVRVERAVPDRHVIAARRHAPQGTITETDVGDASLRMEERRVALVDAPGSHIERLVSGRVERQRAAHRVPGLIDPSIVDRERLGTVEGWLRILTATSCGLGSLSFLTSREARRQPRSSHDQQRLHLLLHESTSGQGTE